MNASRPVRSRPHALVWASSSAAMLLAACATPEAPSATAAAPAVPQAVAAMPPAAAAARPAATAPATPPATSAAAPAARPVAPATGSAAVAPAAGASAAAGAAPTRPAPAAAPGSPPPFAEVTREARRSDGFLPVWTKDERVWLEIPAALLDKPFFFGSSRASGLGERFFAPGLMGRPQVVVLRRVGNTLNLVARNLHARAPEGTPLAQAVTESYSDSLLASAPLAAAPHAQSKALLVDAAALLGGDFTNNQTLLEMAYRVPYALDRANSQVERARASTAGTFVTVRQHHAVPRLPTPPATPPANPAGQPTPPSVVPDARSLFLSQTYTLAPLPAQPLKPRPVDPRVGYFHQSYIDFGNDAQEGRRTHVIHRWRLEKKDPSAAVSEPKEPIRAVLDRNIPEKWRAPLREGVLEWNKAFERAGFRNAIVLEQQAADADWSTLEGTRVLAIRWYAQDGPGSTAIGPSQVDPRTGEILRGAALIDENRVRVGRARLTEVLPRLEHATADARPGDFAKRHLGDETCEVAEVVFDQLDFALELMALRGQIDPNGPEAERYIAASLKDVTMHEVGHALGLRHNFRASASVKLAQLRDPAWVAANGLSPSVMEYQGSNTPLEGEPVAPMFMGTLGAYDYWAIELGYREWPDAESEKRGRAALLARADTDPMLAYATDGDLGVGDPLINQRDMGDDPLAWTQRSLKLSRELLARVSSKPLPADDDYTLYRRTVSRVFATMGAALPVAAKMLGGVYTERTVAGSGKALVTPVPAAQQRAALELIAREFLDSASFRFDPKLMSRLGTDRYEGSGNADFSVPTQVLGLQRGVLDSLMSDTLASRLADAEAKVADPRTLLSFAEVQERLSAAVWSELGARGGAIQVDSLRRNLQREHVKRLSAALVRPTPAAAADVRPVLRQTALQLQARLQAALAGAGGKGASALVRAHLDDSLAQLVEALKAPVVKQGV